MTKTTPPFNKIFGTKKPVKTFTLKGGRKEAPLTVKSETPPEYKPVHRDHYANMRTESIKIMEEIIEDNVEVPMKARLNLAMAQKHLKRAGTKNGEPWEKDIEKAINYLTRALTGEWIKK